MGVTDEQLSLGVHHLLVAGFSAIGQVDFGDSAVSEEGAHEGDEVLWAVVAKESDGRFRGEVQFDQRFGERHGFVMELLPGILHDNIFRISAFNFALHLHAYFVSVHLYLLEKVLC